MTPNQLKKTLFALRDRLTLQQSAGQGRLASDSGRFLARAPINQAEQASEEQDLNTMASSLTVSTEMLTDINEALDRLDAGQFNVCDECKKEIGLRRLKAQPWAHLCIDCKRKLEEGES